MWGGKAPKVLGFRGAVLPDCGVYRFIALWSTTQKPREEESGVAAYASFFLDCWWGSLQV